MYSHWTFDVAGEVGIPIRIISSSWRGVEIVCGNQLGDVAGRIAIVSGMVHRM